MISALGEARGGRREKSTLARHCARKPPLPSARKRAPAHCPLPGFTLIEILVVIIVLGLLAGLVGPRILGRVSEAKSASTRTQIELFSLALDNYRLDNSSYPTTEQGLAALMEKPSREPIPSNWRGPYLRKAVPLDPWGKAYAYHSPGEHNRSSFDLLSLGSDGQPGGEEEAGDITNW